MFRAVTNWGLLAGAVALTVGSVLPAQAADQGWQSASGPVSAGSSVLQDFAVTGPRELWAVGSQGEGPDGKNRPLAARYDGRSWRSFPVPDSGGHGLYAVSAAGRELWATRGVANSADVLHFDGRKWAARPVANEDGETAIWGVKAFGPRDVWVAGGVFRDKKSRAVLQHFDGRSWKSFPVPVGQAVNALLFSLDGTGPSDLWAVGGSGEAGKGRPLALHWNGRDWRQVPVPTTGPNNDLITVDIVNGRPIATGLSGYQPPSDGTARSAQVVRRPAARKAVANPNEKPLAYQWNGRAWVAQQLPVANGLLWSASPDGRGGAWAVGQQAGSKPLVLRFDGRAWNRADIEASVDQGVLYGVATLATGESVAGGTVGRFDSEDGPGVFLRYGR